MSSCACSFSSWRSGWPATGRERVSHPPVLVPQELKLLLHRSTLLFSQGKMHGYVDTLLTMLAMLLKVGAACWGPAASGGFVWCLQLGGLQPLTLLQVRGKKGLEFGGVQVKVLCDSVIPPRGSGRTLACAY